MKTVCRDFGGVWSRILSLIFANPSRGKSWTCPITDRSISATIACAQSGSPCGSSADAALQNPHSHHEHDEAAGAGGDRQNFAAEIDQFTCGIEQQITLEAPASAAPSRSCR